MAELTPRARRILLALGAVYALVNSVIGVHSGGDFVFHLRLAERLLQGQPPYADFNGAIGLPWPPFAIFALGPFALLARLSLPLTKAVWAVGNVALFGWCVVRGYQHVGRWTPVVLAVAAVAQPLQSNFQHLNINLVLLALVVRAIGDLEQGREMRAALWIGVATALKGYPGAIFLYFLARGRWRPLAVGVTAAGGLSFLVVNGISVALVAWLMPGFSLSGLGAAILASIVVGLTSWFASAFVGGSGRVLAVLLAPLDRLHYYVFALPAWTDLFSRPAPARGWRRAAWLGLLGVAALLTSGMLSHISSALPTVLRVIRQNTYNVGAIILLLVLVTRRAVLSQPPQPSPTSRPL
ncbi:MAG: hypothetical protein DMD60_03430 [Gemmatimonadetes bacterium]|nr:MAG: hypothetical protein DMD60_03430 [Gemmatimonadota bacterium]